MDNVRKGLLRASFAVTITVLLLPPALMADNANKGPLKVFILAGQSNMEGQGKIALDPNRNEGKGSLEYLVKDPATADRFEHLKDARGEWTAARRPHRQDRAVGTAGLATRGSRGWKHGM